MKRYTFLDPIHGGIELDGENSEEKLILDLIETPEFQRLRRIRQLGFSFLTFYGAEGSRFVHSIGVFCVARQILNELQLNYGNFVGPQRTAILVAALLHDIGHGPFSHSSEPAFDFEHEEWTLKIIQGKTSVNSLLKGYSKNLIKQVCDILQENTKEPWVSQVVSGQLDCDRADYLIRDSQQTGTKYGVFQLDRIIKSLQLEPVNGQIRLVVSEKGIQAVEDYLFARYSMYLQVYHHKKTLASDALFSSLIKRAKDLLQAGEKIYCSSTLRKWLFGRLSLAEFWRMDDTHMWQHLHEWLDENKDEILTDLARRLLNRDLFKAQQLHNMSKKDIEAIRRSLKGDEKYYCLIRECREFPYTDTKKPILVKKNGKIVELSKASAIASALMNKGKELDVKWLFAPKECFE